MKLLIASVGGLGIGVFVEWLSVAAILEGMNPSVLNLPGVSQRAGRTLSYMEISKGETTFSPFPEKGKVDLIISQEFLELIRLIKEGYAGKNSRVLGTTYRYYTTHEKLSLRKDPFTYENFKKLIEENSKEHIVVDIYEMGISDFSNAHLLGLLYSSGYLPFIKRESYEEAIKRVGIEVERNLKDFALGCELLGRSGERKCLVDESKEVSSELPEGRIRESIRKAGSLFGRDIETVLKRAVMQLTQYQDAGYAELYINRLNSILDCIPDVERETDIGKEFVREFAKTLAVRMMYEDIIRVAELKVSRERFKRIKRLHRIGEGDVYWIKDFFRPDLYEIYGILPGFLGKVLERMFSGFGLSIKAEIFTNHLSGFIILKVISKLKFLRRLSLRYERENSLIEAYIEHARRALSYGLDAAVLAAKGGAIVRGYGDVRRDTIERWERFSKLTNPQAMSSFLNEFFSESRFLT
jgi:indolepyruvate ferredoxin oxidoreductase beta subunit